MESFTLRPFRPDDLQALVRHANDPSIAAKLTDAFPHPYTEEAGRAFLDRVTTADPLTHKTIAINDEACGAIGLHAQHDVWRRNMELGYWMAREHRGRGYMTEAIRHMTAFAFAHYPHIDRVFARPFGSNIASQRALEKAGFTLEARLVGTMVKNGVIEDELIYARRR